MRPEFPRLSRFLLPTEGLCTHTNCSHTAATRRAQGGLENSWKRSCEWKWASSGPNPQLWGILTSKPLLLGDFLSCRPSATPFLGTFYLWARGRGMCWYLQSRRALPVVLWLQEASRCCAGSLKFTFWVCKTHPGASVGRAFVGCLLLRLCSVQELPVLGAEALRPQLVLVP